MKYLRGVKIWVWLLLIGLAYSGYQIYTSKLSIGRTGLIPQHIQLFSEEYRKDMIRPYAYESNQTLPFVLYYYKDYCIVAHQLKSNFRSLAACITYTPGDVASDRSCAQIMGMIGLSAKSDSLVERICISTDGTCAGELKDDSTYYFSASAKSVLLSYNCSGASDIAISRGKDFMEPTHPLNILFLKRNGDVYLIVMYAMDNNIKLPAHQLLDMIR